jgi:hypothetical protein
MERASGEGQLGSGDEGRRLISEVRDEEDYSDDSVPSKHVRFADIEPDSRSSKDFEATPSVVLLGMNASAQQSRGNLHVANTSDAVSHMVSVTEDDGVGVSMDNLGDSSPRNIGDKAGIILVSTSFLPIFDWLRRG